VDQVVPGLERWLADGPATSGVRRGARIGVLAHAASVDRRARHAVARLAEQADYRLTRLFAPEHGLWGHEQDMEPVRETVDPWTGLPVVSLYGGDRDSLRPRPEQLDGLDAVVVDLQDVGSRYYTFIYTMSYVMEVAGERDVPVVILDRPNPIDGATLEGPPLDPALSSFVGRFPLPVRHGMTVGEVARLFRGEFGVACDLRVVPVAGWSRRRDFAGTGLPWVPPSPNMPTLATARVYPGGCLVEGTNLSEGRGTTTPFELVGAPWLDGRELARRLDAESLPGVVFRPASFRPMFQKHAGLPCGGVQVIVTDPATFRPFATYLVLLREARSLDSRRFAWREDAYEFETDRPAIDYLLGREHLRERLEAGAAIDELERGWERELHAFEERRRAYLLYD
jgi:uncharacterized protein YbbC (DUF1343 family)